MIYVLYALHIVVCLFLILVVLLQQGKGADLSVFGGGSTQTAFGARGAATLLNKLTVASFVVFIFTTMGIAMMAGRATGSSVIDEEAATAPASDEPAPLPEAPPLETAPAEMPAPDASSADAPAATAPADAPATAAGDEPE